MIILRTCTEPRAQRSFRKQITTATAKFEKSMSKTRDEWSSIVTRFLALLSIFRILRSRSRNGRNERWARDFAHVRTMVSNGYWPFMCTQLPRLSPFFFLFFFDLRLANLEPRFKFQRASRPKEEDRRGLDKLSRRGAATNGFSSFGSCLDPKNGKSLLLLCHCARFSNT